jgi:hypothetical protein
MSLRWPRADVHSVRNQRADVFDWGTDVISGVSSGSSSKPYIDHIWVAKLAGPWS